MRPTVESLRHRSAQATIMLRGLVRRCVASLTEGLTWQLLGYGDARTRESFPAELFQQVGFASRPPGQAEVIMVNVGGEAEHGVIVATRDRSTQVAIEKDETAIFTSGTVIRLTKDGDVLVRAKPGRTVSVDDGSGGAQELATKADVNTLALHIQGMTLAVSGSTAGPPLPLSVPLPAGTTVLKGK